MRQDMEWQKIATQLFGSEQTSHALDLYQSRGAIQSFLGHDCAKEALLKAWKRDWTNVPYETHLMLAYRNEDVRELNENARELLRAQGHLRGRDQHYVVHKSVRDEFGREMVHQQRRSFAQGDRLVFTRNEKGLGVQNGQLGTVMTLKRNQMTVALDQDGRHISFAPKLYPFFDHGWATTIHKSQGTTVDHVKKLASFSEYRNLAYVGMSRHRKTLEIYTGVPYVVERLSRVQEKLSGFDYFTRQQINHALAPNSEEGWGQKKLQSAQDLLNALKVTTMTIFKSVRDLQTTKTPEEPNFVRQESEENRSRQLFTAFEKMRHQRQNSDKNYYETSKHQDRLSEVKNSQTIPNSPRVEEEKLTLDSQKHFPAREIPKMKI